MAAKKPPNIIVAPTPQQLAKRFRPYAIELGYLVYSWNRLQEILGRLFGDIAQISDDKISLAIWYSLASDRSQRSMLRAALGATTAPSKFISGSRSEDITWILNQCEKIGDLRNDAIHSPMISETDNRGTRFRSAYAAGNPRALKLKEKNLIREFEWCSAASDALSIFALDIHHNLRGRIHDWPKRPTLAPRPGR
jgi:hypothetical protein